MAKIKDGSTYLGNHLTANDYYAEHETVTGCWVGLGAERFGLRGEIAAGDSSFENLRNNLSPDGSAKLTPRDGADRVRFYDFQCSAPKSFSILAVTIGDPRLLAAHDDAAKIAFREMESFAATQMNSRMVRKVASTGNVIAAAFRHTASRALDPQVHTHFVTANATWFLEEGRWKALTEYEMVKAVRYAGKVYQNELAKRCLALGYQISSAKDDKGNIIGFEIKGVSKEIRDRFAKRRAVIEKGIAEFITEHGREPTTREIHQITKNTRDPKLAEITTPEVLEAQRKQLSGEEWKLLHGLKVTSIARAGTLLTQNLGREKESLRISMAHIFERRSVAQGHELMAEALNQGMGALDLAKLKNAVSNSQLVALTDDSMPLTAFFATRKGLALEKWSVGHVNQGVGQCPPMAGRTGEISTSLSGEQRDAIAALMASRDQVVCLRGAAGVGKTTVISEIDRILRDNGKACWYCAPTSSAAETLRKEGLQRAVTVADFLQNVAHREPEKLKGSVFLVDEAGLASNKQGAELLRLADCHGARVLFVGDSRQHSAVEAGDFIRMLEDHSNLFKTEITSVRRQLCLEYRQAVQSMALGSVNTGLRKLDKLGWVKEGKAAYLENAAKEYLTHYGDGKKTDAVLAVAPTWQENEVITQAIRRGLKEQGQLGAGQNIEVLESLQWTMAQKESFKNYEPGQVITFNRKVSGFSQGESVEVVGTKDVGVVIRQTNGSVRELNVSGKNFDVARKRLIELAPGDRVLIRANNRSQNLINGELLSIAKVEEGKLMSVDGKSINTSEFKHFSHGYAVTSHKSQSQTVDRVVVAASQLNAKTAYVSVSRGRFSCSVHTPDKIELLAHLPQGNRASALDFMGKSETQESTATLERSEAWSKNTPDHVLSAGLIHKAITTPPLAKFYGITQTGPSAGKILEPPEVDKDALGKA